MYPFPQTVTPAVRSHMDAQTAFLNDMSKSMFRSFQQMCDLNIQLVQTLVEESTLASQQVLSADRQTEMLSAAAARAQPTSDKLRAYQHHISRLAADAQVELARVTEQHVQNTTRTARALVDEVTRSTAEETERNIRTQQEALRNAADPFARRDGDARHAMEGNGEMQRGQPGQGAQQSGAQGNRPAGAATH
ncbi:phasin family protein [Massilia sp. IC2-476]|uniref:phasin family protein n=1 Tax=Massilia sp. IC2-476 TaxID=2887199 RepID=UPI001D10C320|nr:phasin family protein [Massilia sp. IC2-476]MCC2970329.1 phasin family protein [Massilia sp. IC2-476]